MVEIDTPGHTAIISKSHPEHIACPEVSPWSDFAAGRWIPSTLSSTNSYLHDIHDPLDHRTSCRPTSSCQCYNDPIHGQFNERSFIYVSVQVIQYRR